MMCCKPTLIYFLILAIDALTLDYTVKFPLSLVISRKTILRYQLLFRFLLHLKHVEQTLSAMWIEQKSSPWRMPIPNHPEFDKWRLRVFLLRARMLSFVQQILAFATFEVLEPNWRALEVKLTKVTTVDQLLRDHMDFLDTCLKESMLTSAKLLRVCCSVAELKTHSYESLGVFSTNCHMLHVCAVYDFSHKVCQSSDYSRRRS
jgi:gamma-tubulin complex component 2